MTRRALLVMLSLFAAAIAGGPPVRGQDFYEDWTVRYDTGAYAEAFVSIVIDSQGNPIVSFEEGLLKYDASGALQWKVDGMGADIVIDDVDNVYMPRYVPDRGIVELLKIDTNGGIVWTQTDLASIGASHSTFALDSAGNILSGGSADWSDGSGYHRAAYVAKFDPSGNLLWWRLWEPGNYAFNMRVDAADNAIVVVNEYYVGSHIAKLDIDGNLMWDAYFDLYVDGYVGAAEIDVNGDVIAVTAGEVVKLDRDGRQVAAAPTGLDYSRCLAIDPTGDVVLAGNNYTLGHWLQKYDINLRLCWCRPTDFVHDIAVDNDGSVYATGLKPGYPPKVQTWVFTDEGNPSFHHVNASVYYGVGTSVLVAGDTFYVAAYTWYGSYGGSLTRFSRSLPVDIDIKPGEVPNTVNLGAHGFIPVAILSSADFDATTVNATTVELAGADVAIRGNGNVLATQEDVNGDGRLDLVCQVESENLEPDQIRGGVICLTGEMFDGRYLIGCDQVLIVPSNR